MKIQFAVVDPDQLQAKSDISLFFGILASVEAIDDYTILSATLAPGKSGHALELKDTGESLTKRCSEPLDELHRAPLHDLIGRPVWKQINSQELAGELVVLRTDLPTLPPGHHHGYIVMGLIKGDNEKLKCVSGRINRSMLRRLSATACGGISVDTGNPLKPQRSNDIMSVAKQPLWGFGEEKVGMSTPIHPIGYWHIETEREHLVMTGLDRHGRKHPNTRYVEFLRELTRRQLPSIPLWITDRMDKSFAKLAAEVMPQ